MATEVAVEAVKTFNAGVSVDVGPNALHLLQQLATTLNTTVDKIFPWYVTQSSLEGYLTLGILASIFLTGLVMFTITYNILLRIPKGFDNFSVKLVLMIVSIAMLIASSMGLCSETRSSITKIQNPHYHAMQAITTDMGKLVGNKGQ
jgi:hypothetical protein